MLKKMLIQGMIGATLIAAAAAVYGQVQAQTKPQDNGYLAAPARTADSDRDGDRKRQDMRTGEHRAGHADRERSQERGHDHD